MLRFALATLVATVTTVAATSPFGSAHAQEEPTPETVAVAEEIGVDPLDLQGAVNTTQTPPRDYAIATGLLAAPNVLDWRVACIESKESGGANIWNRLGSGAGGVMQYMAFTFLRGALELGHADWSLWIPWQARIVADHDLRLGRRAQWTVSGC